MDKKDEQTLSMDKPKPLEEISGGDLSEIKKDPIWKTYLRKAKKKRVRLGDISDLQKLPKGKPSKYKDPQTMTKIPKKLGKPVRKIESAMGDGEIRVLSEEIPIAENLRQHLDWAFDSTD